MPSATDFVTRAEPIAFFLTWTTYGSWLPGDRRGWTDNRGHLRAGEPDRASRERRRLAECPLTLSRRQQRLVADVIEAHCAIRGWTLHALHCRSQHIHVVITAVGVVPEDVLSQFKAWTTRRLKAASMACRSLRRRERWWTEGGSKRWIYDAAGLEALVKYVKECQDKPRETVSRHVNNRA